MKHTFYDTGTVKGKVHRDAHDQGKIYVETQIDDKRQIERNTKIRNEELLPSGSRSAFMDGDVIAYAFSFPTVQNYDLCKKEQPDLMKQAQTGTDTERFQAARRLAILYPQYVISHHKRKIN